MLSGLDESINQLAYGVSAPVAIAIAILLGLRHVFDPDHLVTVGSLVAAEGARGVRVAATLGSSWGLGHATSLILAGLPVLLLHRELPTWIGRSAEVAVGLIVLVLAVRLFRLSLRSQRPASLRHRSPLSAYGIGLVHGVGGSAGITVLLLASIGNRSLAALCLLLFALSTAVSMATLSGGLGHALLHGPLGRSYGRVLMPALGSVSLLFGLWYLTAALG